VDLSNPLTLLVCALVIVVALVGQALFWYFRAHRRTLRKLAAVAVAPIGHVQEGTVVRIVGTLENLVQPLTAPISGRACVAWHAVVEAGNGGARQSDWRTVIDTGQYVGEFLLRDATGVARVRVTSRPRVAIVKDSHAGSGPFNQVPPHVEAFLRSYGEASTGVLGFNRNMRYQEGALQAGEQVAVIGKASFEPDPHAATHGRPYRVVIDAPGGADTLILSDDSAAMR
jgi:hypothetical protein